MNDLLSVTSEDLPVFGNKKLNAVTKQIFNINVKVRKNLFQIASILAKVENEKLYEDDGFKSCAEYAMKTFGYKKSMAYSLVRIGNEYTTEEFESVLPHDDVDYTVSQVERMLPLKSVETAKELASDGTLKPTMSCKEIADVVKKFTKGEEPEQENATEEPEQENTTEEPEQENEADELVVDTLESVLARIEKDVAILSMLSDNQLLIEACEHFVFYAKSFK